MKTFVGFIWGALIALFVCDAFAEDWHLEQPIPWAVRCNPHSTQRTVIHLHGAQIGSLGVGDYDDYGESEPFYETLFDACTLIVRPRSGVMTLQGNETAIWDFTNVTTNGEETAAIIEVIHIIHKIFPTKPVYLYGGSAGAIMAQRVAAQLHSQNKSHLLAGLILVDGISPFTLSITEDKPYALTGFHVVSKYSIFGITSYIPDDSGYGWVTLGLPSDRALNTIPTYVVYSLLDSVIPDEYKKINADNLVKYSRDAAVSISGFGHHVGEDQMRNIAHWILNN